MSYVISFKSGVDVISLSDLKSYLMIDGAQFDALIMQLEEAAVCIAEKEMNRDIIYTDYENYRATFDGDLTLRRGGFSSLTSVEYLKDGSYVVLPTTEYTVSEGGTFGCICELFPPSDMDDNCNAVKITFRVGFGASTLQVPHQIKLAIKQIVAFLFENRGDCSVSDTMPPAAKAILRSYKLIDIVGSHEVEYV